MNYLYLAKSFYQIGRRSFDLVILSIVTAVVGNLRGSPYFVDEVITAFEFIAFAWAMLFLAMAFFAAGRSGRQS